MGKRIYSQTVLFNVTIIILLFSLSGYGCKSEHSSKDHLENTKIDSTNAQKSPDKPIVYFGFITRYNPRIMYEEYQPIVDYLSRETPYRFEIKLGKSYQDAVEFLKNGDVQIGSFGAVTYVEAHFGFGAIPILKPLNKYGEPFYRSLIVVRDESDIRSLEDLNGRSFAFASVHSTSGNLIPRYNMAKVGVSIKNLKNYINLKHHDSVAKAVLSGEYEAGAVKDIIGNKYLSKGLRILHESEPIPSVPLVVRADCDPKLIESVKRALLKIDITQTEYRQLVSNWNEEFSYGFAETSDEDYSIIRNKLNAIPGSCGNACHPLRSF